MTVRLDPSLRGKNLDQIEGVVWDAPEWDFRLVRECHRLRRVPLAQFGAEQFRLMIGQGISLASLVPLALELLAQNPWVEGDLYPGDLLSNVLAVPDDFWQAHPELREELDHVVKQALAWHEHDEEREAASVAELATLEVLRRWRTVER